MLQEYIQHVNDMLRWQDEWLRHRENAKISGRPEAHALADEALRNKKLAEQKVRAMKMDKWLAERERQYPGLDVLISTLSFVRSEIVDTQKQINAFGKNGLNTAPRENRLHKLEHAEECLLALQNLIKPFEQVEP